MNALEKEKRAYYLFSKINDLNSDKIIYNMVIDHFIHKQNAFSTLMEISENISATKRIKFSPETIQEKMLRLNFSEVFENFDNAKEVNHPFRLKKSVFETLSSYSNYVDKLYNYTLVFLESKSYNKQHLDNIIDILLEMVFNRNIQFLKKIITAKQENIIKEELQLTNNKNNKYSKKDYQYYNEMIESSNSEFDEILKMLILKMFDFLSLNYNPQYKQTINQKFGGKTFYLDSSFILRLLGFDNKIREERSIELIALLKEIPNVEFIVHRETIKEAQYRIKELINFYTPIIKHSDKIINKVLEYIPERKSGVVDLFFRLKTEGKVSSTSDFLLYFADIKKMLQKVLGIDSFKIDNDFIQTDKTKQQQRTMQLRHTDKTALRIKHIVRILNHLDNLRGPNNYNPFDIQYWLITTDSKTLQIDNELCEESDISVKSACILPTELIRMMDGLGEIVGDHVAVFKKFILSSHIFSTDYTQDDIKTIDKISAQIESIDLDKYDSDILIDNLFQKNSFDDIQNRLNAITEENKRNEALIELFNEANEHYIDNKYTLLIQRLKSKYDKQAQILFWILSFTIPILIIVYLFIKLINSDIVWNEPKTYFLKEEWDDLSVVITIFEVFIMGGTIYLYKNYKKKFKNWYTFKRLEEYRTNK
ncbi:MAG: hypothetical protein E6772_08640 [Dysgonomonas sp.]|nr:hypothetical protein [Dysgonomonas sp.]